MSLEQAVTYDQRLRWYADELDELDEQEGRRIFEALAGVADMIRRIEVRENWRNAFYRREKALSLLVEALELVTLLAELDAPPGLDDDSTDRLYQARKTWRQSVVDNAIGLWEVGGE